MKEMESTLKKLKFLESLDGKDIATLAGYAKLERFRAGEVIFKEGSKGDAIYLIVSGKVEITKMLDGREVILAVLEDDSPFGEMDVLSPTKAGRVAGVRAKTDCELVLIPGRKIGEGLKKEEITIYKLIYIFTRVISNRLRKMDEEYTNLYIKCSSDNGRAELKSFREKIMKEWQF